MADKKLFSHGKSKPVQGASKAAKVLAAVEEFQQALKKSIMESGDSFSINSVHINNMEKVLAFVKSNSASKPTAWQQYHSDKRTKVLGQLEAAPEKIQVKAAELLKVSSPAEFKTAFTTADSDTVERIHRLIRGWEAVEIENGENKGTEQALKESVEDRASQIARLKASASPEMKQALADLKVLTSLQYDLPDGQWSELLSELLDSFSYDGNENKLDLLKCLQSPQEFISIISDNIKSWA